MSIRKRVNSAVIACIFVILSALSTQLVGCYALVYAGEREKVVTESTKNATGSWLISKGILYLPKDFSTELSKLLSLHNPAPIVENKKIVKWIPERAYVLQMQDVTFYSVAYRPEPNMDVESMGLLLIVKKTSNILYEEASNTVSPAYTSNPVPALSIVKNKGSEFVILQSYEDLSQKSFLRIISPQGEIIDGLITPGRGEFRIDDLDGNGILEIFGYGIAINDELIIHNNTAIKKDLRIYRVPKSKAFPFTASLGAGATGKFQIFSLNNDGMLIPLAGGSSKKFYEEHAKILLPYIKKLALQNDKQKLINAVVAYLGVIEGARDPETTLALYDQLPSDIRKVADPVAIAMYWKEEGYPFLSEIFK